MGNLVYCPSCVEDENELAEGRIILVDDVWKHFSMEKKAEDKIFFEGFEYYVVTSLDPDVKGTFTMRMIPKRIARESDEIWSNIRSSFMCEVASLTQLTSKFNSEKVTVNSSSDHTLDLFFALEDSQGLYIVSELQKSNLLPHLYKSSLFTNYSEQHAAKLFRCILLAIHHCHTHNVSHLNLSTNAISFSDYKILEVFGLRKLDMHDQQTIYTTSFERITSSVSHEEKQLSLNEDLKLLRVNGFQYSRLESYELNFNHFLYTNRGYNNISPEVQAIQHQILHMIHEEKLSEEEFYDRKNEVKEEYDMGKQSDIWALGCLLYFLVTGYHIRHDDKDIHTLIESWQNILVPTNLDETQEYEQYEERDSVHIKHCKSLSKPLKNILSMLLHPSIDERYSIDKALSHPWVNQNNIPESKEILQFRETLERQIELQKLHEEFFEIVNMLNDDDKEKIMNVVKGLGKHVNGYFNIDDLCLMLKHDFTDNSVTKHGIEWSRRAKEILDMDKLLHLYISVNEFILRFQCNKRNNNIMYPYNVCDIRKYYHYIKKSIEFCEGRQEGMNNNNSSTNNSTVVATSNEEKKEEEAKE